MHWGHAVSTDLVHWTHLPIALYPDELGTIFSGSAAIDRHNTAGFGANTIIAAYTYHLDDTAAGGQFGQRQSQAIAYSTDRGRTWTKYQGNPIIPANPEERDFRDPKIFWYVPDGAIDEDGYWILLLAVEDSIWFFQSEDLKSWRKISEFGENQGSHAGVWETPDLFHLPVENTDECRWVLSVGLGQGAPAGGSGMQYFIGTFDGTSFTNDNSPELELWADHGADFYAAQGWNNEPNGRQVWLGWMNNWIYANQIPTPTWRGAMSIPRSLSLRSLSDGIRIVQRPIRELEALRKQSYQWYEQRVKDDAPNLLEGIQGECLEVIAQFDMVNSSAIGFGFHVRQGDREQTAIQYDVSTQRLIIDRTKAGACDFHTDFAQAHESILRIENGQISLHLFIDRSSVEIFGNSGSLTLTEQIFPSDSSHSLELFVTTGTLDIKSLIVFELASIYG